jgi:hypothetical protein
MRAAIANHPCIQVDAIGGERKRLTEPTSGVTQREAEGPGLARGMLGRGEKARL